MNYSIYTSKMHNQAIYLSGIVNKVLFKYRIESFSHELRKNAPRNLSAKPYIALVIHKRNVNVSTLLKPM